jgi:hypothetical protein
MSIQELLDRQRESFVRALEYHESEMVEGPALCHCLEDEDCVCEEEEA